MCAVQALASCLSPEFGFCKHESILQPVTARAHVSRDGMKRQARIENGAWVLRTSRTRLVEQLIHGKEVIEMSVAAGSCNPRFLMLQQSSSGSRAIQLVTMHEVVATS